MYRVYKRKGDKVRLVVAAAAVPGDGAAGGAGGSTAGTVSILTAFPGLAAGGEAPRAWPWGRRRHTFVTAGPKLKKYES